MAKKKTPPYTPSVAGSRTSVAAAQAKVPTASSDEGRVFQTIKVSGKHGMTDDELEVALNLLHQTASARRRGLELRNFVMDSGRSRPTRTGRQAIVWIVKTKP